MNTSTFLNAAAARGIAQTSHETLAGLMLFKTAILAATEHGDFSVDAILDPVISWRHVTGGTADSLPSDLRAAGYAGIAAAVASARRAGYQVRPVVREMDVERNRVRALVAITLDWRAPRSAASESLLSAEVACRMSEDGAQHMRWLQSLLAEVDAVARRGGSSYRVLQRGADVTEKQWEQRRVALARLSYSASIVPNGETVAITVSW